MKWPYRIFLGASICSAAILFFQNCSRVELGKPEERALPDIATGTAHICLTGNNAGFTIRSFYISNSNTIPKGNQLVVDTDGDGLSDEDEITMKFSPVNRRTASALLDSICFNLASGKGCEAPDKCDSKEGPDGLSDCDKRALSSDNGSSEFDFSFDSDEDGISDYLEVIRGKDPLKRADATADSDNDGILDFNEIAHQYDLNFYQRDQDIDPIYEIKYNLSHDKDSSSCAGELWSVAVDQIPLLKIHEYKDVTSKSSPTGGIDFSHATDQNNVIFWMELMSNNNGGQRKMFIKQLKLDKLNSTFNLGIQDFIVLGGAQ